MSLDERVVLAELLPSPLASHTLFFTSPTIKLDGANSSGSSCLDGSVFGWGVCLHTRHSASLQAQIRRGDIVGIASSRRRLDGFLVCNEQRSSSLHYSQIRRGSSVGVESLRSRRLDGFDERVVRRTLSFDLYSPLLFHRTYLPPLPSSSTFYLYLPSLLSYSTLFLYPPHSPFILLIYTL